MTTLFLGIALFIAFVTLVPVFRMVLGPTIYDRVLGVGLMGTNAILLLVLIGFIYGRIDMFVDLAIAYAVLNFVGMVVVAKYLERRGEKP
ncbi:MAG: monovalent cation/H+ antiporter complex subunit F [Chloroflexota bacterium]|nr:monovalent cation/H+ antiporter complex subunit F [Chloroflexota bacterium]